MTELVVDAGEKAINPPVFHASISKSVSEWVKINTQIPIMNITITVSKSLLDSNLGIVIRSFRRKCLAELLGKRSLTRSNQIKPKAEASADLNHIILIRVLFTTAE